MNNQKFKVKMLMEMILIALKLVNTVVVATISAISLCVPDVVKNLNVKVFNLVSGTNEKNSI